MAEILNAHGSRNDIFVTALTPRDFASEADVRSFVRQPVRPQRPVRRRRRLLLRRRACRSRRPGSSTRTVRPPSSAATACAAWAGSSSTGAGPRPPTIRSGPREYTVRRGATTPEGVRQVRLEHPPVDFAPDVPVVAGRSPAIEVGLPELDPALAFTAVTIPNPHLVAVIDKYVESDLVAMGERVAARRETFPAGANLSVLLPLTADEVFVRTFERGAGLTASCGSGMAAARAVYSRIGQADPNREVVVRNAGGMATASLRVRDGRWFPVLQGNATFVYRADVDPVALTRAQPGRAREPGDGREPYPDEIRAYAALDEQNAARLRAVGIETG